MESDAHCLDARSLWYYIAFVMLVGNLELNFLFEGTVPGEGKGSGGGSAKVGWLACGWGRGGRWVEADGGDLWGSGRVEERVETGGKEGRT